LLRKTESLNEHDLPEGYGKHSGLLDLPQTEFKKNVFQQQKSKTIEVPYFDETPEFLQQGSRKTPEMPNFRMELDRSIFASENSHSQSQMSKPNIAVPKYEVESNLSSIYESQDFFANQGFTYLGENQNPVPDKNNQFNM
jgi:hypothetical protein